VLCVDEEWRTDDLLKVLGSLCDEIRAVDEPLWYGREFGPAGPLLPEATTEGFVIIPALYFDRGFDAFECDGREILVMMLAPAHASEMGWLAEHGIEDFIDQIKACDAELVDLGREPMGLAD
jgi:hypothetical protein